ncbi:hypothetical protein DWB68_00740 [Galactobacter valiniphilus]|uniref:Uncharacterized protein n=1 Tax=Galactobacter valiniphilus TaxID=2676122 RepID=A0A399JFL3_9MICC|nr:hypothetical protein [Galactobacter valiniphilus]RII43790.1 hypothetical protein DWB68_00740 [Galactobacter valiniphilus]
MSEQANARAVLGPFTARETTYLAGAVVLALASLFSFGRTRGDFAVIVLGLLAPLAAAGGVAWRRLRGRARLDLGSFSLDQLCAVVAAAALVVALGGLGGAGAFAQLFAVLGAAALFVASWGASWISVFGADYVPQAGVPLLRRDIAPSEPAGWSTPGARRGAAGRESGARGTTSGGGVGGPADAGASSFGATSGATSGAASGAASDGAFAEGEAPAPARSAVPRVPHSAAPHTRVIGSSAAPDEPEPAAFWFAVPDARPAENRGTGAVEFTVEPGEWFLAVRTLPEGLVVRHDDGREGLLRDTSDLELG